MTRPFLFFPIVTFCTLVTLPAAAASEGASAPPSAGGPSVAPFINGLGVSLYREVAAAAGPGNVLLSPYAALHILLMLTEGARGGTAAELAGAVGLGSDPDEVRALADGLAALDAELTRSSTDDRALRAEIEDLGRRLEELDAIRRAGRSPADYHAIMETHETRNRRGELSRMLDPHRVRVANALWLDRLRTPAPAFAARLTSTYGALLDRMDRADMAASRRRVDAWVSEHTMGRIPTLGLPSGVDAELLLATAVYFGAEWLAPFEMGATRPGPFHRTATDTVSTLLMQGASAEWRYAAFEADGSLFPTPERIPVDPGVPWPPQYPGEGGLLVVELPYRGERISMILAVPDRPDGLAALENGLTRDTVSGWAEALARRTVSVVLPRFRFETEDRLDAPLQRLGIRTAFRPGADFSAMTSDGGGDLFVGRVLHKAYVEVNERGTEAAAVMAAELSGGSRVIDTIPFVPAVRADRPFLFVIRDRVSGAILFLGRLADPALSPAPSPRPSR